jgi:phytoene desaturase
MKKVIVIGSGLSSLAGACYLSKEGYDVLVLEKNNYLGGRLRQLSKDGFTFDMGPSFYWMPDVFERFFNDFGYSASDFYKLIKLDPGYRIYFGKNDYLDIHSDFNKIVESFENIEKGSGDKLKKFIEEAKKNYSIAIDDLVYEPGVSIFEIVTPETVFKINEFFISIRTKVRNTFNDYRLRYALEFPSLFLGAKPENTPMFYNFMNYADYGLGTWHPDGGMYKVAEALVKLGKSLGVKYKVNQEIKSFKFSGNQIEKVITQDNEYDADIVLSGADYAFTESLLPEDKRQYSKSYWDSRIFAPSTLLFYVAFNKKLDNVLHHTLFFDASYDDHAKTIYDKPEYPAKPLFYTSFASKTDKNFAPEGKEAGVFLIPIAPGLHDNKEIRERYFNIVINRLEEITQQSVKNDILFYESFSVNDFINDYHSFKGNAYGLANTLLQTHYFRPKLKSDKVKNLYFCGQLTVPGPGLPPSLISGKLAATQIIKNFKTVKYERII